LACNGFSGYRPLRAQLSKVTLRRTEKTNAELQHFGRRSLQELYGFRPQHDDDSNEKTNAELRHFVEVGRRNLQGLYGFPLDDWQLLAGGATIEGHNVIVSAPTGAGKTVVGEMALHMAFQQAGKTGIYTTPLKALSNQKYSELLAIFGRSNTGLSTGDISVNKGARITVMTTEVYRNIAWRSSIPSNAVGGNRNDNELQDNAVVVLDEFHYMGQVGRGGVWEESVITSPNNTQIVGLSATLSNAQSLASWMESVTGRRTILVEVPASKRPVPLRYLFATKDGLYPLFRDPDAGPGAPKGLLGYRGDGIHETLTKKRKGGSGFDAGGNEGTPTAKEKIPRGLQVNPALRDAAIRRLEKIDRAIERQKFRGHSGSRSSDEWNEPSPQHQVYKSAKKLNAKEEQKERERLLKREMRRAVPSMHALMMRLDQRDMLPAIFFIFSRVGCDEAARLVYRYMIGQQDHDSTVSDELVEGIPTRKIRRQREPRRNALIRDSSGRAFRPGSNFISDELILSSLYEAPAMTVDETDFVESAPALATENWSFYAKAGLLRYKDVGEVASRIALFNKNNEEIQFPDEVIQQYLLGVGSHHAGMLPAHKSFVEALFRNQLMKVVFATETLAAGINMPARTTVICSLAKRGNGGTAMNLLETSNLLQMAGRAGRRGMDTDGTCVIVATPFESHDDAVKILTDPIAPISSQFSPSYSLCVNLIARGEGELTVAKQLVSKSFAMWERRQVEELNDQLMGTDGNNGRDILSASAHDKFLIVLVDTLRLQENGRDVGFDISDALQQSGLWPSDLKLLKKSSKSYAGMVTMLKLETVSLEYLEKELAESRDCSTDYADYLTTGNENENEPELAEQVDMQRKRVEKTTKEVNTHPFTFIAAAASNLLYDDSFDVRQLRNELRLARGIDSDDDEGRELLSADELSTFAKSAVVLRRKTRKLAKATGGANMEAIVQEAGYDTTEDSWDDFLSITRTLVAYGCLTTRLPLSDDTPMENAKFDLTPAGLNLGMLGFENSLWALTAMGGAWDVTHASYRLDEFRDALKSLELEDEDIGDVIISKARPQQEADALVSLLRRMSPSELAGYVSSLISEDSRGGGLSVVEMFQRVTPLQQQVVQKSLLCLERLIEVQKLNMVDEATRVCNMYVAWAFAGLLMRRWYLCSPLNWLYSDISNCEVVTAWADGCSWSEALQISGSPPGDLARILGRVLDAVRQFGNLPFAPVRREDGTDQTAAVSRGLDPEVRRLCREASRAMNRYPVKDPLAFASADDGEEDSDDSIVDDGFDASVT
jgi:superfamily II RNA helicase